MFEKDGRQVLNFERHYPFSAEKVFSLITDPDVFVQWYPFATGDMNLQVGGKIKMDDGEGSIYEAVISEINEPHAFCFQELDDLLEITLNETNQGCTLVFRHTFDDQEMVIYTATGWHRCLNALDQIIHDEKVEWEDNAQELLEQYKQKLY